MIKLLDLCCGLGGWSKGFADEKFDCTGVDIKNYGYPYRFIQSDIMDFHTSEYYDVVVASPPCTEFSIAKYHAYGTQVEYQGLDLVYACFDIILNKIKPQFWIVENVKGLSKFLGEPNHIVRYGKTANHKSAYLYGNFPIPGLFGSHVVSRTDRYGNSDIRRSEIPYPMARAFAKAIRMIF